MNQRQIRRIISDLGHIRVSCSKEEEYTAGYLAEECRKLGIKAQVETFELPFSEVTKAVLTADGKRIPCTGYQFSKSGSITAPLVYVPAIDPVCLKDVKGKIVLLDNWFKKPQYEELLKAGIAGFITYDGDVKWKDRDIDTRELRYVHDGLDRVFGANVNAKDAVKLVEMGSPMIHIEIEQTEGKADSFNTVAEIPGTTDEWIVLSAHLDSRPTAPGVWDNLTGCITLLETLETAARTALNRYGIKALFCGSEERGLQGARAFVRDHESELEKFRLNVNVDMIGSTMGQLMCMVNGNDDACAYMRNYSKETGMSVKVLNQVMSSDSTIFADKGIPALAFGNMAPRNQNVIHCRYDDGSTVSVPRIKEHAGFIAGLTARLMNSYECPIERTIPANIREELDKYLNKKKQ
ncbi:MAG: M28 family peptidase [Firmicutes bacterium]|nr:M28 family peptidase [Bacillota bacterium]MBQ6260072.1 M28 family peptidase [Bacillota bacterium]